MATEHYRVIKRRGVFMLDTAGERADDLGRIERLLARTEVGADLPMVERVRQFLDLAGGMLTGAHGASLSWPDGTVTVITNGQYELAEQYARQLVKA